MAIGGGLFWGVLVRLVLPHYFSFLIAIGVGWAIGEVIALSVNRKRGRGLVVIAGVSVVVSYLVAVLCPWGFGFALLDLVAVGLGIFMAANRLR
jgi:hypothetical protein